MSGDAEHLGKWRREQLAKAELLLHLAMTASRWGRYCTSTEQGVIPFDEFPPDDPLVTLARTYNLTGADLAKVLETLADELEGRAIRAGYADHLDPVPPPAPETSNRRRRT